MIPSQARPATMARPGRAVLVAAALFMGMACIRRPPEEPIAVRIWPDASGDARRAVAAGAFPTADTTLARFARQYSGSPQAQESLFLLALFRLDPRNTTASPRDAVRAFDAYLATDSATHAVEARSLRRLALRLDSLSQPAVTAKAAEPIRDEELQKLRDSLTRATEELERIKRRLAQPRP